MKIYWKMILNDGARRMPMIYWMHCTKGFYIHGSYFYQDFGLYYNILKHRNRSYIYYKEREKG